MIYDDFTILVKAFWKKESKSQFQIRKNINKDMSCIYYTVLQTYKNFILKVNIEHKLRYKQTLKQHYKLNEALI